MIVSVRRMTSFRSSEENTTKSSVNSIDKVKLHLSRAGVALPEVKADDPEIVRDILLPSLMQKIYKSKQAPGRHKTVEGIGYLDKVIDMDQSPIGRTPRSNPATYTGVFDHVRRLFAQTAEAKIRGYLPGRFSFNVSGGRCEACSGDGTIKIEMHFLPDVYVPCEVCKGARYNRDTLDITFKGKNIAEVLDMPCEEALTFFANQPVIGRHMQTIVDVGLGYVRLGQPAPTLSGGRRRGSSSRASWPSARPVTPSTCWTSPPPGCTSRTCDGCSQCCPAWSTRATPCS